MVGGAFLRGFIGPIPTPKDHSERLGIRSGPNPLKGGPCSGGVKALIDRVSTL